VTPDSAVLVTLSPGDYTAEISGASGDTGVALVEVYALPWVLAVTKPAPRSEARSAASRGFAVVPKHGELVERIGGAVVPSCSEDQAPFRAPDAPGNLI
jgi:hypothetical protein